MFYFFPEFYQLTYHFLLLFSHRLSSSLCFVLLFDNFDCFKFWKFTAVCLSTISTCLWQHVFKWSFIFPVSSLIFFLWHLCINTYLKKSYSGLHMMSFSLDQLFSRSFSGEGPSTVFQASKNSPNSSFLRDLHVWNLFRHLPGQ